MVEEGSGQRNSKEVELIIRTRKMPIRRLQSLSAWVMMGL